MIFMIYGRIRPRIHDFGNLQVNSTLHHIIENHELKISFQAWSTWRIFGKPGAFLKNFLIREFQHLKPIRPTE